MMNGGFMNGGEGFMGWGGMFFGPLVMIGFLVLIVWAVIALVKQAGGGGSSRRDSGDALAILKERFAAGDIDKKEYEEKRALLG